MKKIKNKIEYNKRLAKIRNKLGEIVERTFDAHRNNFWEYLEKIKAASKIDEDLREEIFEEYSICAAVNARILIVVWKEECEELLENSLEIIQDELEKAKDQISELLDE